MMNKVIESRLKRNQLNVLFIAIDDLCCCPDAMNGETSGSHPESDRWRYIRYEDDSEELYDHQNDGKEFHNLADREAYASVKQELASWLPKYNAEPQ